MAATWKTSGIARTKELFDHRTPIAERKFLSGRSVEIARLVGAIEDRGAHAIIFGDRGVGKTSISRCIYNALLSTQDIDESKLAVVSVNCDSADTYTTLWRKVFGQIVFEHKQFRMGFRPEEDAAEITLEQQLEDVVTVNQVRHLLATCGEQGKLVVIIDEFERLERDQSIKRLLADTVKTLADFVVPVTLVFVGVGESLAHLIQEHESLTRHLVEVPVPRLRGKELTDIIDDRLQELGMTMDPGALYTISYLSKGLPFYVHLLARFSVIAAIERESARVERQDMNAGFNQAVANAKQALKGVYYTATLTNQAKSQHRQCLAACAMADTDLYGYFTASSVAEPMSRIIGHECNVGTFNEKLVEFCEPSRGRILQRTGKERAWRYRFSDPMMGPFVLLASLEDGIIFTETFSTQSK